ncbi:MAG TPA: prepilin peptidase, partial [Phycisphaerales bacterium]|nr:prepilin peptidase [Phycisphaerales bacterium]
MPDYEVYRLLLLATWAAFVLAFGACVGSLINVLVYRLPRGLSVVTPPSRCPACGTRLTWRENIPVLGWLLLRGRCRFCRGAISPEYPIVEAVTGLLFLLIFLAWYVVPAEWLAVRWGAWELSARPEWAMNDARLTWPYLVAVLLLVGSLIAMTLIDARTSTIPLVLPWFAAAAGVLAHPLHALWVGYADPAGQLRHTADGYRWTIPTPGPSGWWWIGASLGGMAGLGASCLMLRLGLITRSFADYDQWEASVMSPDAGAGVTTHPTADAEGSGGAASPATGSEGTTAVATTAPRAEASGPGPGRPELWVQYPHARREMVRELAFLAMPVLLGLAGGWLAARLAGGGLPGGVLAPLWLEALAGSLMGYLVGGGVVWGFRVFGSLAFGKEAM